MEPLLLARMFIRPKLEILPRIEIVATTVVPPHNLAIRRANGLSWCDWEWRIVLC